MTSRIGRSAAVWLALVGAGCNASFPTSPEAFDAPATRVGFEVLFVPQPSLVLTGSLVQFLAYTVDSATAYQYVAQAAWTSSDPSVLRREGAFETSWRAVSPGVVEVTATFEGAVSSVFVTVVSPQFPYLELRGLAIPTIGRALPPLEVWINSGPNNSRQVSDATWTSSNTRVATVSASGVVTGINIGTAEITASSGGLSASYRLSVLPRPLRGPGS